MIPSISHAALDPAAQERVRRLAEDTAAVASAQAAANRACVRGGGSGAQACLASQPTGDLAAAIARTTADVRSLCETFPPFGAPQRLSGTANAAGTLHEQGLVADLFGADRELRCPPASARRDARRGCCRKPSA